MANDERESDELERDPDDARGFEDEDDLEDSDEEDLEDEEQYDADEGLTGEIGSEGGSPGETVVTRRRSDVGRGSEAGETWSPEQDQTKTVERVGERGQPRKRNP